MFIAALFKIAKIQKGKFIYLSWEHFRLEPVYWGTSSCGGKSTLIGIILWLVG